MRRFYTTHDFYDRYDDCEWSARSIPLSGADHDGDPTGLVSPSLYPIVLRARSSPPLSRVRFHPMTIAQRTTLEPVTPLSNSEALAMPRTPTTTCTFLALGCPRFRRLIVTSRHGRNLDGHRLSIQVRNLPYHPYLYNHQLTSPFKWAKNPPSSVWRYDRDRRSPPPAYRSRDRSRSPRRRGERERERVDDRDRDRDRDRERDYRDDRDRRRRSRSPVFERRRTPSPDRRATKERVDDRARTPPPPDDLRKEDIKAVTPPYDR